MVKIGIIGCGGMGRLHTKILKNKKNVRIVAASDIDEKNLYSFQNEFKIEKVFSNYRELLKIPEIDSVIIATPTFTHYEIVMESAKAKKNIFCEKPIALKLKEAEKMVEECEKNSVKFQIGFVRRFDEEWLKFRELIQSGIIGRPVQWRQISGGSGPRASWYYEIDKGGGPFIDGAVHSYDFAIYTFGKPVEVNGTFMRFKKVSSPDTGTVDVKFETGDILTLCWSWGLPERCSSGYLHEALGPEGVLTFAGYTDEKNKWFLLRKAGNKEEKIAKMPHDTLGPAFEKQMDHFINCIENNREPIVGGKEAIEALKIWIEVIKNWR